MMGVRGRCLAVRFAVPPFSVKEAMAATLSASATSRAAVDMASSTDDLVPG